MESGNIRVTSVEKPDKHYLKINIKSGKSHGQYTLLVRCGENGTLPLWSFSLKQ